MATLSPGHLIAFEGIDGGGKSTQARALAHTLASLGREVLLTREPTDGPDGQRLRASARTGRLPAAEELALFVSDRRKHVAEEIIPALQRGAVVIIDRYYLSTAAYQGVRGLDPEEILALNESFAPSPDLVVLIDVDPAASLGRVRGRDGAQDAFEREDDLRRCREIFLSIANTRPFVHIFDGLAPADVLQAMIFERVMGVLNRGAPG